MFIDYKRNQEEEKTFSSLKRRLLLKFYNYSVYKRLWNMYYYYLPLSLRYEQYCILMIKENIVVIAKIANFKVIFILCIK